MAKGYAGLPQTPLFHDPNIHDPKKAAALSVYPQSSKNENYFSSDGDHARLQTLPVELHPLHHQDHVSLASSYTFNQTQSLMKQRLKHRIRILKLFTRIAATSLAIATGTQEGQTLYSFITTHSTLRDGRGPWALETQLWTSILLFSISLLTAILGAVIIVAYLIPIQIANNFASNATKFFVAIELGHILIWLGVTIAYRVGKNGKDLWGWACSPLAAKIQPNFEGVVQFNQVCERGVRLDYRHHSARNANDG